MAQIIKTDGTTVELKPDGKSISLGQMQAAVGGYVEQVPIQDPSLRRTKTAYCNEDGRAKELPFNVLASAMLGVMLVGDVVVCDPKEFR